MMRHGGISGNAMAESIRKRQHPVIRVRRPAGAKAAKPRPELLAAHGRAASIDLGPLTTAVGYLLRRAQMAVFGEFIRSLGEWDMRPGQYSVLAVIGQNPGLKQAQVSETLGIHRGNFVLLFDELERRGLAIRKRAEADRRSHALYLTPKGRDLVSRMNELQNEHEHRIKRILGSKNRDQLVVLLGKIIATMREQESVAMSAALD
jgi:DNA-binding MarR family transcriptional regulator